MTAARPNPSRALRYRPPVHWHQVEVLDAHTGGEPLRILLEGVPEPEGATMLAKRESARRDLEGLRRALMLEPRGHADMYGALPTAPVTADGDLGVLFLHNEGWSTMCGHGILALTKVALDCGLVERPGTAPVLRFDTPAGRVVASARRGADGTVDAVAFENVPSFLVARDRSVDVPDLPAACRTALGEGPPDAARVRYDLGYGGAYYAYVTASDLGLELVPAEHDTIVQAGAAIQRAARSDPGLRHPSGDAELDFLYGVIFVREDVPGVESRNVCVFAEGELDRSPTGTGVSGRAACLHGRGALACGVPLTIESLLGSRFEVEVLREVDEHGQPAVIPRVTGRAHLTGRSTLWIDPADRLGEGFLLRNTGA